MNKAILKLSLSALFLGSMNVQAAERIELSHMPLATFAAQSANAFTYKVTQQEEDFRQTLHTRYQETYQGYPVWGTDFIVHTPDGKKTLNGASPFQAALNTRASFTGHVFQNLQKDLSQVPASLFSQATSEKAIESATQMYQKQSQQSGNIQDSKAELMVYVDTKNLAHWTFLVSFYVDHQGAKPENPHYLIDATTQTVYLHWDDVKTYENKLGGGFGGNPRMHKHTFDGLAGDLPALHIQRDENSKTCFLQNDLVHVYSEKDMSKTSSFPCNSMNADHNAVYWDDAFDTTRSAYSPDNDALYIGQVISDLYQTWYGIPVLSKNGRAQVLTMVLHGLDPDTHTLMDNAYWFNGKMTFGDGDAWFYPLVALDIGAHEVSHGFTEQHSNLIYVGESGGLDESFSDMAAAAAEYFTTGRNSWMIGADILKINIPALRFMNHPSMDCEYFEPCSIDNVSQMTDTTEVHSSSGIYNRAFYLMSTAPGWDTHKAFNVMVQANRYYWTMSSTFNEAACGVLHAAKDLSYDPAAINAAFQDVGISTSDCISKQ